MTNTTEVCSEAESAIRALLGFDFSPNELQTVNAGDLLAVYLAGRAAAAPVVERQEPKGAMIRSREYVGIGQGGRELWHDWSEWSTETAEYAKSKLEQVKGLTNVQFEVEWLYTSPPAPVAVVMPDRNDIVRTIAATCYFEAKDPALVAGWTYDYIFNQLVALAKVKELNQ